MARTDEAELAIRLEARIKDFEKNMAKAQKTANRNFQRIEKDAEKSTANLEGSFAKAGRNIGSSLKAGLVAGLSVAAVTGMVRNLASVAREVANVGSEAKRAGVSAKAFQELGYVARQNRIDVDALVDGLKELNLRADEFVVTGKGPAAEAFARLGYSASQLKTKLRDPSDLIVEIIGRMERLDRAAQIRVADEIFGGTAGERFVELLDKGAEGVRTLIAEANQLGLVLDDELIAKADEIDRRFAKITDTISVNMKRAVVEVVDAMDGFFDQFRRLEAQADRTIQLSLRDIYSDRQELIERIADLKVQRADTFFTGPIDDEIALAEANLKELTAEAMRLRDVLDRRHGFSEEFTYTGDRAKEAAPKVSTLGDAVSGLDGAGANGAKGLKTFADAVRALKDEIPGLVDKLADMDARTRIDTAYRSALSKATSIGDTLVAEKLRDQALGALSVTSATRNSTGYLSGKLAAGRPASYITDLDGTFADNLAKMMASAPEAIRAATTITSGARSVAKQARLFDAAVKKYGSVAAARKWVAPPGKSRHNAGQAADLGFGTDDARAWFHKNAGSFNLTFPMRHEPWHIEDAKARRQAEDSAAMETFNASETQRQAAITKAKDQAAAYQEIVQSARKFRSEQGMEQQALTMTAQQAAALRYEHQLLNGAQRAGIALSPQQRAELQQLARGMAEVEAATIKAAASQEEIQAAQGFLSQQIGGFFTGIITGSASAEEAIGRLLSSLAEAALQAALFGQGPLGSLFGGGAGILGAIFGFSGGGVVKAATGGMIRGPGTGTSDSIPARLSDGEFVINAKATAKHRRLIEAINADRVPAFATGGLASARPVSAPSFTSGSAGKGSPITINSSVEVKANGGDEKQNADLAKKTAAAVDAQIRATVQQELRNASRPGGAFGR